MFIKSLCLFLLLLVGCKKLNETPTTQKNFALSRLQDDALDPNFIENLDNKPMDNKPSVLNQNINHAFKPKKIEWSITPHADLVKKIKENPEGTAEIIKDIDIKKPEVQGNIKINF